MAKTSFRLLEVGKVQRPRYQKSIFPPYRTRGVKIVGKRLQQSCVVFSVTLTLFVQIRLVFLKAAFAPELLHTQAKFLLFVVQVQFQYCDSYTLSACKSVKINQSFLSRVFHWHHWRICLKTDGIVRPMESKLCMKRNNCINDSILFIYLFI